MSSSSSSTPTTTSDAASQSPTQTGSGGGGSTPSSTLYLLTFLATLFVLLFVSSAIVLRSFVVRRRFRRQVEAQIAAGLLPPEAALQLHHRWFDFGEKPKLWDLAITPAPDSEDVWEHWDDIEPVAVSFVTSDSSPNLPGTPMRHPNHNRFTRFLEQHRLRPPAEPPTEAHDNGTESSHEDGSLPPYKDGTPVQVAVFVRMPTPPSHTRPRSDGEIPIPDIAIGVAKVPLRAEGDS